MQSNRIERELRERSKGKGYADAEEPGLEGVGLGVGGLVLIIGTKYKDERVYRRRLLAEELQEK